MLVDAWWVHRGDDRLFGKACSQFQQHTIYDRFQFINLIENRMYMDFFFSQGRFYRLEVEHVWRTGVTSLTARFWRVVVIGMMLHSFNGVPVCCWLSWPWNWMMILDRWKTQQTLVAIVRNSVRKFSLSQPYKNGLAQAELMPNMWHTAYMI